METKFDNGFRVISTDSVARIGSTVSLYFNVGARNETFKTHGVSHFTQRFFYGPTNSRTFLRLAVEMQKTGASVTSQNGREEIVYRAEGMRESMPKLVELMADSVFQTRLHDYDLAPKRNAVETDIEIASQSPELLLNEAVHYKAFGGKTLGNSIICPPHNLDSITNKTVADFMDRHFTPNKAVLVGTHINHEDLVRMAEDFFIAQPNFVNVETDKEKESQKKLKEEAAAFEGDYSSKTSTYIGGDHQMAEMRHGTEITHAVLAFKGESFGDIKSHYALAVVAELLGQGSQLYTASLAGRSSRLHQNVIAQIPQLVSAKSFNLAYSDNGLFGVHLISAGSNSGSSMTLALQRTVDELKLVKDVSSDKQLDGAKNRVLFALHNQTESAESVNEFRYRFGTASVEEHAEVIKQLTKSDVQNAVAKLLASKPTLVTYGNLHNVATTNDLVF